MAIYIRPPAAAATEIYVLMTPAWASKSPEVTTVSRINLTVLQLAVILQCFGLAADRVGHCVASSLLCVTGFHCSWTLVRPSSALSPSTSGNVTA